MTLKENVKTDWSISTFVESERFGIKCEKKADEYAIEFAEWLNGIDINDEVLQKHISIDELLQQFKKEKGQPLFSSHMLDLSEESIEENIQTSVEFFKRMAPLGMGIEIELGVTGGEEDGVDNSGVENDKLYTQPEHVAYAYTELSKVGKLFTIAAAFGNVHGVYSPGNVELKPVILHNSQVHIEKELGTGPKPVYFVFHGGSGSLLSEIRESLDYGVIKMNIDTDTQYAFTRPVVDHVMKNYDGVLKVDGEVGNKKAYDPRAWGKAAEAGMAARVAHACEDLRSTGTSALK